MDSLFPPTVEPADIPAIPGLVYLPEYVSKQEERQLVTLIDEGTWNTEWERRRQGFGGEYGRDPSKPPPRPIPAWGRALADRMFQDGLTPVPFDSMLINEYVPGQGIAMHRDYDPFGSTVTSLSLLSAYVMDFHHPDGHKESLLLEPRSLLVLRDEARYVWEHGIARRKSDVWKGIRIQRERRISVTHRFALKT